MKTTVIETHSDLHRTVWRFWWSDGLGVVLDDWRDEKRETKRHKFKASAVDGTVWSRLNRRDNRIDEPHPPAYVQDDALHGLRMQIDFKDA